MKSAAPAPSKPGTSIFDVRSVAALILAAGESRRMGRPKALLRDAQEQTLLARAIATARSAGLPPLVAVRAGDAAVAQEASRCGARVVEVPDAGEGMAASIRAGTAAVQADREVQGVLILLVDQWRIEAHHLRALVEAWETGGWRIAAARYGGVMGVPAVFGREFFEMLLGLEGDRGARDFLRSGDPAIAVVDLPAAAEDLDTSDALSKIALPLA